MTSSRRVLSTYADHQDVLVSTLQCTWLAKQKKIINVVHNYKDCMNISNPLCIEYIMYVVFGL